MPTGGTVSAAGPSDDPGATRKAGTTSRASFLRRLVLVVLLLNLFIAGFVALSLDQSRRQYQEQAVASGASLSHVLERDVAGTLARIDLALLSVADEYQRRQRARDTDGAGFNRFIIRLRERMPEIDALRLTDARGTVVHGSDMQPGSRISLADRPHFIRVRDDPAAGLVISMPLQSRVNARWILAMGRRVENPDGSFAGMAIAPMTLDQFAREFAAVDVGRHGSVSLRDREQNILARHPVPAAEVLGKPLDVPELRALIASGGAEAGYVSEHTVDHVERRFSVRRIGGHPLYIVVGRATDEILAPWRREAARGMLMLVLFSLGTLIASWLIYDAWRRQMAAADEAHALNTELERRVTERTAQLEAANKELEEFSYSVSHDLRTPLRAIAGFTQIIEYEQGRKLDAEGLRLLGVVRDNAVRMGRLIDGIIEFLHLGRRPLHSVYLDVIDLARDIFARNPPAGRAIHLATVPAPPAHADMAMIHEALTQLLSNAVKFTAPKAEARIEVGGSAGERENTYYVRDNGIGFDMRYADKLFRVFEHLHAGTELAGTGIGLALVQRIIHRHGGRVWAEGREGEGATFYFTLPAAPP